MAMEDKEYLERVKKFIDTTKDRRYNIPKIPGVMPFTLVDHSSEENRVAGLTEKWCVRIKKEIFSELNVEKKNNPNCVYDTCFTNEEYKNNSISTYSAYLKQPEVDYEADLEVFGSRIFNYFGIPTVYNKRIEVKNGKNETYIYLASVDALRQGERFHDLRELIFLGAPDLKFMEHAGLDSTIDKIADAFEKFLKQKGISYDKKQIEQFKAYLVESYILKVLLCQDGDFRNGNSGTIINEETKTFRCFPNFDFNCLFAGYEITEEHLNLIEEIAISYPKALANIIAKLESFVATKPDGNLSDCERMFNECMKRKGTREICLNRFYKNANNFQEKAKAVLKEIQAMEEVLASE